MDKLIKKTEAIIEYEKNRVFLLFFFFCTLKKYARLRTCRKCITFAYYYQIINQ